jgi:uncharacterized protein (DUF983 family)
MELAAVEPGVLMRRTLLLLARAWRLRCPACGGGPIFRGWFQSRPACPGCGLRLEREEGYYLGAMLLNLIVAELGFVAGFAVALVLTWPNPPWRLLTIASMAAVVLFPLVLYPFSRTVWLALDLLVHPPERHEYHDAPGPADSRRQP